MVNAQQNLKTLNPILVLLPSILIKNNHLLLVQLFSISPPLRRAGCSWKKRKKLIASENFLEHFHLKFQIITPDFIISSEVKMWAANLLNLVLLKHLSDL